MANNDSKLLRYLNLSDRYERLARFAPGLLTILVFAPAAFYLSIPILGWVASILTGIGVGAVFAVGLSQLSSAVGNKYQRQLFPNWPHDCPTNMRLSPLNSKCSAQQRKIWCAQIREVTGLDIEAVPLDEVDEVEQIVNDAITEVRTRLWKHPQADRLHAQNTDYGFARNFAGFGPFWLTLSTSSFLVCWITFFIQGGAMGWPVVSTIVLAGLVFFHFVLGESFVRAKSEHYGDSLFNSMQLLIHDDSGNRSVDSLTNSNNTSEITG